MAEYIERGRLLTVLERNFGSIGGAAVMKQLIEAQREMLSLYGFWCHNET